MCVCVCVRERDNNICKNKVICLGLMTSTPTKKQKKQKKTLSIF